MCKMLPIESKVWFCSLFAEALVPLNNFAWLVGMEGERLGWLQLLFPSDMLWVTYLALLLFHLWLTLSMHSITVMVCPNPHCPGNGSMSLWWILFYMKVATGKQEWNREWGNHSDGLFCGRNVMWICVFPFSLLQIWFPNSSDCCWFLREVIGSFWKCGHPWKDPVMKIIAIVPKALGDKDDFQIPRWRPWSTSEHMEEMSVLK